ncbi:molybdopterin-dependent oxidoreductase [Arthrobacter sp. LAPM80]|uniref:molybdopterin-dependent oxidoreductase n=1 Tax=Arthrobacter sp. LAPM80 TaxID=3141788 RepID=UPI00398A9E77
MPDFFPFWVVTTHFLNLDLMLMLFRSGIEVLAAFPKLYWHDDCPPGRQWVRFSKKNFGADSRIPWSSLDEEESWSPVIALPGRKNLGLGRHWHFMTIQFWILTGAVYIVTMFATGYLQYIVPTHWSIILDSTNAIGTDLQFQFPAKIPGQPFEPAQKLAYFVVIFLLAPLQILTGAAMSPSVLGRFTRYGKLFGGKQGARSLHFLIMCAFAEFLMVHVVITWFSLRYRRRTQRLPGRMVDPFERAISRILISRQSFTRKDISPYFRFNGYPPPSEAHRQMAADDFRSYQLTVGGLVSEPMRFSLTELRELGEQRQITKHSIQGWTAIAKWAGIPLADVMQRVKPHPDTKHVVFYGMDDKGLTEGESRDGFFYGSIPIHVAGHRQTLLALEMNGAPLPIEHGAPIRLRLETQLGSKRVKWIQGIEFVTDDEDQGMGMGG